MALIVTGVLASTPDVVTEKVPVVAPAATVTEAGTVTLELPELKETTAPPAGAGLISVTVPPDGELPPTIETGEMLTLDRPAGFTVNVPVTVVVAVAEIVTTWLDATMPVVIVKLVLDVLAGIVTVAGTVAAEVFELLSVTTVPDGPERPFR